MKEVNGHDVQTLPDARFGGVVTVEDGAAFVAAVESAPDELPQALYDADGFLLLKGMGAVSDDPELLIRLSRPFGAEVEDYAKTSNRTHMYHPASSHIIRISNLPPVNFPTPDLPDPPRLPDGGLPVQFPQRRGWHTDQSFRRPPPDISLFYAHQPAPRDQGQTLYADGVGAYEALDDAMKARVDNLLALHVAPFKGYGEDAVMNGEEPQALTEKDGPQAQPVVRVHPVTGRKALYLCEREQIDWRNGPFVGMEPGIAGDGRDLLYALMEHYTQPAFTYAHHWDQGDLVIYDNRCTIHSATWFDAEHVARDMWRTTVWGNPGPYYDGEVRSWEAA
jgi:taurine dioxygenase